MHGDEDNKGNDESFPENVNELTPTEFLNLNINRLQRKRNPNPSPRIPKALYADNPSFWDDLDFETAKKISDYCLQHDLGFKEEQDTFQKQAMKPRGNRVGFKTNAHEVTWSDQVEYDHYDT